MDFCKNYIVSWFSFSEKHFCFSSEQHFAKKLINSVKIQSLFCIVTFWFYLDVVEGQVVIAGKFKTSIKNSKASYFSHFLPFLKILLIKISSERFFEKIEYRTIMRKKQSKAKPFFIFRSMPQKNHIYFRGKLKRISQY